MPLREAPQNGRHLCFVFLAFQHGAELCFKVARRCGRCVQGFVAQPEGQLWVAPQNAGEKVRAGENDRHAAQKCRLLAAGPPEHRRVAEALQVTQKVCQAALRIDRRKERGHDGGNEVRGTGKRAPIAQGAAQFGSLEGGRNAGGHGLVFPNNSAGAKTPHAAQPAHVSPQSPAVLRLAQQSPGRYTRKPRQPECRHTFPRARRSMPNANSRVSGRAWAGSARVATCR